MDRLSPRLRNLLLKRSLYDVLCDIWFMPKLGTYIKLLIGPIFLGTSREAYQELLKKVDNPMLVEKLNRKGLVYFMPGALQDVMLPFDQAPQPCLRDLQQETLVRSQEQEIREQRRKIATLATQNKIEYSWDNFLVASSSVVMMLLYSLRGKIRARVMGDIGKKRLYSLLLLKLARVPYLSQFLILVTNFMAIRQVNRMIHP